VKIVVGYTPTPEGLAAVDYAATAATSNGATLYVVNTGERGNDAGPAYAEANDWDALEARLTAAGIEHEMHQPELAFSAAEEILKVADDVSADLIVIGLRRRSPVGKLFLGSISQQVILDADCPVVAVKRPA
jgi:nucleotide-binding universal stress UspA family protein